MLAKNINIFSKNNNIFDKNNNIFNNIFEKNIINFGKKYHYFCAKMSLNISLFLGQNII